MAGGLLRAGVILAGFVSSGSSLTTSRPRDARGCAQQLTADGLNVVSQELDIAPTDTCEIVSSNFGAPGHPWSDGAFVSYWTNLTELTDFGVFHFPEFICAVAWAYPDTIVEALKYFYPGAVVSDSDEINGLYDGESSFCEVLDDGEYTRNDTALELTTVIPDQSVTTPQVATVTSATADNATNVTTNNATATATSAPTNNATSAPTNNTTSASSTKASPAPASSTTASSTKASPANGNQTAESQTGENHTTTVAANSNQSAESQTGENHTTTVAANSNQSAESQTAENHTTTVAANGNQTAESQTTLYLNSKSTHTPVFTPSQNCITYNRTDCIFEGGRNGTDQDVFNQTFGVLFISFFDQCVSQLDSYNFNLENGTYAVVDDEIYNVSSEDDEAVLSPLDDEGLDIVCGYDFDESDQALMTNQEINIALIAGLASAGGTLMLFIILGFAIYRYLHSRAVAQNRT